eukprot:g44744.t1
MAFDDASPNCKAVQRCFTVEEVRNEEVHSKCYTKIAWTDFVDSVVAAGQKAYEDAKAAGTVDTYCALLATLTNSTCSLTLKKIRCSHRELVLKNSGVYIVAEQSHAVAVDCARRLIFNPCFERLHTRR